MLDNLKVHIYLYSAVVFAVIFAIKSDSNILSKILTLVIAIIHCRWGMYFLHSCGMVDKLFGMEMLVGIDRIFQLCGPHTVITTVKIDAPDDLEEFRSKVIEHFMTFKRCKSVVKQIGSEFFLKETTKVDVLNGMVTIHQESLTEDDLCKFIAREHEAVSEREDPFLPIKIWLIPVDTEET